MVMRSMRANIDILKWMFVLLLVVFGIGLVMPSGNTRELASAAAVVNGQPVNGQTYSRILQNRLEAERQNMGGELSEGDSLRIRRQVLEDILEEELSYQHAEEIGQKSSEEEFKQAVTSDPSFRDPKTGQFSPEMYQRLLAMQAQQGIDWKEAEAQFQRGMVLQKVRNFFSDQALLDPMEQAAASAKLNRQLISQAAVWDVAKLKAAQNLSDADIEAFYADNKQRWAKPEEYKISQILIKTEFGMASGTAKSKADAVLAKLKAGASFAATAKAESGDAATKDKGGDLGWMDRDSLDPNLSGELLHMKVGQVSGVLSTPQGFHILKLNEKKAGFEPTLANSKGKAKDELAAKRASRDASAKAHAALNAVKKGSTLEAAAKAHGGSVVLTGWFNRDSESALSALGKDAAFAQEQLGLDKGEAPENPIVTEKAVAFAIPVQEKAGAAPSKPELAAARSRQALALARRKKADLLYKAWVEGLRAKASIKDQIGVLPVAAAAPAAEEPKKN